MRHLVLRTLNADLHSQTTVRELESALKDRDARVARLEADRDRLLARAKAGETSHQAAEALWVAERDRLTCVRSMRRLH